MAIKELGKIPTGPLVRWSNGAAGVLTCTMLSGATLRLELLRGEVPLSLTLERMATDFYAGSWVSAGRNPARGSASVAVTRGVHDVCRLSGQWYEGSTAATWVADGVTLGSTQGS